jgi:hypothetical protein
MTGNERTNNFQSLERTKKIPTTRYGRKQTHHATVEKRINLLHAERLM